MRTVFNRSAVSLRIPFGLAVLTALTLGGGIVMWLTAGDGVQNMLISVLLLLIGVLSAAVLVFVVRGLRNPHRLEFRAAGITLQVEGRTVKVPWSDIESWDVAEQRLRAFPASHVENPAAGALESIWSVEGHYWVLCEPDRSDASADELAAAVRKFAADKER